MNIKRNITITSLLVLLASVAFVVPAFAQTNVNQKANANGQPTRSMGERGQGFQGRGGGMMKPSVSGTVTGVSGYTITLSGHTGFGTTTESGAITYTITASDSTVVKKDNATSTLSVIAVGDQIIVQGTISGTSVTATSIFDGVMMNRGGERAQGTSTNPNGNWKGNTKGNMASTTPVIGNGQPVIAGTVSAISGSSITITTTSNVTYTVDASSAKFLKGNDSSTLASIVVGDKLMIQGTVSGNSVTASTIIDQAEKSNQVADNTNKTSKTESKGFFGGIGQFFSHLFGF